MREILFRGKLSHSKVWVEGNIVFSQYGNPYILPSNIIEQDGHHLQIIDDNAYWVDIDTIGQFTGLTDRNGTKIFEGDTLTWDYADSKHFNEWMRNPYYKVVFEKGKFFATGIDITKKLYLHGFRFNNCEVIGNIHDNPELT